MHKNISSMTAVLNDKMSSKFEFKFESFTKFQ